MEMVWYIIFKHRHSVVINTVEIAAIDSMCRPFYDRSEPVKQYFEVHEFHVLDRTFGLKPSDESCYPL